MNGTGLPAVLVLAALFFGGQAVMMWSGPVPDSTPAWIGQGLRLIYTAGDVSLMVLAIALLLGWARVR